MLYFVLHPLILLLCTFPNHPTIEVRINAAITWTAAPPPLPSLRQLDVLILIINKKKSKEDNKQFLFSVTFNNTNRNPNEPTNRTPHPLSSLRNHPSSSVCQSVILSYFLVGLWKEKRVWKMKKFQFVFVFARMGQSMKTHFTWWGIEAKHQLKWNEWIWIAVCSVTVFFGQE